MRCIKLGMVEKFLSNLTNNSHATKNASASDDLCQKMFGTLAPDDKMISIALNEAIDSRSDETLDLILTLIERFNMEKQLQVGLAGLLTLPWHHFHDRVAGLLNNAPGDEILPQLYDGATFRCDNLDYESDYFEFNRKCIYALLKNGSEKSYEYIRILAKCENKIVADYAAEIIEEYDI